MAQYVSFDPSLPSPQPIIGWYDAGVIPYPNLPPVSEAAPAGFLSVTAAQWTQHLADLRVASWSVVNGLLTYTAP